MSTHIQNTRAPRPEQYRSSLSPPRKPSPQEYDGYADRPVQASHAPRSIAIWQTRPPPETAAGPGANITQCKRLSRGSDAIAKGIARESAKKKAKEHKETRKRQKEEEKLRKRWLGGVAWGFDPTAGIIFSKLPSESDGGCYVSAGRSLQGLEGVDEIDDVGRPTGRRWVSHDMWGVEHGGPGQEGKLGHGSLRDRGGSYASVTKTAPNTRRQ
jgi:hypothetical protein